MSRREPHEHPLYRFSSIGRPVDPRFASNKAIIVLSLAALLAGALWGWTRHGVVSQAALSGGTAALVSFVSWALGRELDPDVNATAFVAVALALGAWVVFDDAGLLPLLVALGLARLVNRSVGPAAMLTDQLAVASILGVVVIAAGRWSLGIAGAVAFGLDAMLVEGRRRSWVFAVACLAFVVAWWVQGGVRLGHVAHPGWVGVLALVVVVSAVTLPGPKSACDLPGHRFDRRRVQGGTLVVLLAGLGAQLETTGDLAAPTLLATLSATLVGRAWPRP